MEGSMDTISRPPIFLTPEELVELTGRKSARHQIGWLDVKGWKHEVNAVGRPIVARTYAEYRLGSAPEPNRRRFRPNFATVENA